jgi:hypothetical protein
VALTAHQCISYALSRPAVSVVLAGAHSVEQLEQSAAYCEASEAERDYAAALASFPYVPEQAQAAMEYFYYKVGDRLWGEYGFRDAFSFKDGWFAKSYIAIDEGPIVVMMENHRTGLLWDCFMQDEDVRRGLTALGFTWE